MDAVGVYSYSMASDNGWVTPVYETHFTTEAGEQMVRVVSRRKTGLIRIYIQLPDGTRMGISVTSDRVLAAKGTHHEAIRIALDEAEKKADSQTAQPVLSS